MINTVNSRLTLSELQNIGVILNTARLVQRKSLLKAEFREAAQTFSESLLQHHSLSFPFRRKSCSALVQPALSLPADTPNKWLKRDLLKAVRECRSQQPGHSARPTP